MSLKTKMPYKTDLPRSCASSAVIFIDSAVENYKELVNSVNSTSQVIVLNSNEDGVSKITDVLQGCQEVTELHIVSHGSPGSLKLGNTDLSLDSFERYHGDLKIWSRVLSSAHDSYRDLPTEHASQALYSQISPSTILLYGCNVAAGDAGAEFIEHLHQLTGVNIAASANLTGCEALGGDWNLEVTTAKFEVSLAFPVSVTDTYASVLNATSFQSDDFNSENIAPQWTIIDPLGDGFIDLTGTGTEDAYLELSVAAGTRHDMWNTSNDAVRVMQSAANDSTFDLEVKFESEPAKKFQLQGILVEQDNNNWIRFDTYSNGDTLRVFAATTVNGVSTAEISVVVAPGAAKYLRVSRDNDLWTLQYSADGANWLSAGNFSYSLAVSSVGTFAGNAGANKAFTSRVDYFFNTAAPIIPEDGVVTGPNQPPVANNDVVTVAPSSSLVIDVLGNDSDSDGTLSAASVTVETPPNNGTATVNTDGTITYSHTGAGSGNDSFTYTVLDDDGAVSNVATVNVTIGTPPPNQPPVASNDNSTVNTSGSVIIDVLGNDSDSDGTLSAASVTVETPPNEGTATVNADGTITYSHTGTSAGNDSFTYTVLDDDGAISNVATVDVAIEDNAGPQIDIWYGQNQEFGQLGQPQTWVNILGNVDDPDNVVSLSYSLNGGENIPLVIGSDGKRLVNSGDFNVDIAYADLNGSSVDDTVVITVVDGLGNTSTETVTIEYESGNVWSAPYSIDWSSASKIQDAAQIVDGKWALEGNSVGVVEAGYDRLLSVGDTSWTNYEVTVPITINSFTRNVNGIGFALRWNGHTDDPLSGFQPKAGWEPSGDFAWWYKKALTMGVTDEFTVDRALKKGRPYVFKARAETSSEGHRYSLKVWQEGQNEPTAWDIERLRGLDTPASGSLLLIAHQTDANFGNLNVYTFDNGDDILMGIDPNGNTFGTGEIDELTGLGGADTFILGDSGKAYYDDKIDSSLGIEDYALITDFSLAQQDVIQLHGNAADYVLGTYPQDLPNGTAIYLKSSIENELIALVQDVVGLDLGSTSFSYV